VDVLAGVLRDPGEDVHLRSTEEPPEIGAILSQPTRIETRSTSSVLGLPRGPVVEAMRGGAASEGFVFAGLMPSAGCSMLEQVRPPQGTVTALELLDEIVRQRPDRVWLVTYEPIGSRGTLKVGVPCRDQSHVLVDIDP